MFRRKRISEALNVYGPVDQARRCLDLWLKNHGRAMGRVDRQKLSALMARYFENEDQLTDQLMMSFLNHYIGQNEVDMDDPVSVRMEIKDLLDKSVVSKGNFVIESSWPIVIMVTISTMLVLILIFMLVDQVRSLPMTVLQQDQLKAKVEEVAKQAGHNTTATVWTKVKKPLNVRRYQNITYWQFDDAMAELDRIEKTP